MKKVILSTIAAAALTTSAMAETKVGLGVDVMTNITNPIAVSGTLSASIGSTPVIRVSIDGLADGVRIEPRFAYISADNATTGTSVVKTMTVMGIGGYYDLSKTVSVGAYYDTYALTTGGATAANGTSMAVVLKAEAEIAKNFSIASELGYAMTATTEISGTAGDTNDMHPVASVTMRMFF